jgi:hypothetical protein
MNTNKQYPIGIYKSKNSFSKEEINSHIESISTFPKALIKLIQENDPKLLKNSYRENGWSGIQVIHHCADSHMNSFIRFKLALTEDKPTIKPYLEEKWANTTDGRDEDFLLSIGLLEALHSRWVLLLRSLSDSELEKTFIHPSQNKEISLKEAISLYAWHCNHHLAHLKLIFGA